MTDLYHEMRDNMTLPAAVASLKNGWGARRIGWPEWMYIEQLQPTGDLIIWGKPTLIAKDFLGNENWDHDYTYWKNCTVEDALASDWCVCRLDFLQDFVLHRLDGAE